jgi:hypothetical protein
LYKRVCGARRRRFTEPDSAKNEPDRLRRSRDKSRNQYLIAATVVWVAIWVATGVVADN